MESDIIVKGFQLAEKLHRVKYMWFISDGDSSMYHSVVITCNASNGHYIQKVECTNHAVKCYWNRLKALCKYHPQYHRYQAVYHAAVIAVPFHFRHYMINKTVAGMMAAE